MSPCKSGRNRCLRCFFVEMKDLDLEDRTFAGNAVNQVMEILRCYSDESDLHGYYFYSEVKCPEVRLFFFHILVALEIFAPLYILLCDSFSLLQMHPDGSRIAHWLLQQLLLRRRSLDQSQPALRADIAMIAHQSICPSQPCADLLVSRACNIAKAALRPTPPVISSCVRFIRGYDFPDDTNTTKYYAMQGNLNWTSTTAKLATCGTPEADNARLPVLSPIRSLSLVVSCMEELIGRQGQ